MPIPQLSERLIMARIPQPGGPPYVTPDIATLRFSQDQTFKDLQVGAEYICTVPQKFDFTPTYFRYNNQLVRIKIFNTSHPIYNVYVIKSQWDGEVTYMGGPPIGWIGVNNTWLKQSKPKQNTCICPLQTLMVSGCKCGGD